MMTMLLVLLGFLKHCFYFKSKGMYLLNMEPTLLTVVEVSNTVLEQQFWPWLTVLEEEFWRQLCPLHHDLDKTFKNQHEVVSYKMQIYKTEMHKRHKVPVTTTIISQNVQIKFAIVPLKN